MKRSASGSFDRPCCRLPDGQPLGAWAQQIPSGGGRGVETVRKGRADLVSAGPSAVVPGLVWTVPGLLSSEECMFLLAAAHSSGFQTGELLPGQGGKRLRSSEQAARVVDTDVAAELAQRIAGAAASMGFPLTLPDGQRMAGEMRVCQYSPEAPGPTQGAESRFTDTEGNKPGDAALCTLVIYLSDGFEGGSTRCVSPPGSSPAFACCLTPPVGGAVIFRHDVVLHADEAVQSGTKYVLQSGVFYRFVGHHPRR
eukprot:jgi/Tetstr1/440612/TSEL_028923.t2